jgi:penicillin-binding protein 2
MEQYSSRKWIFIGTFFAILLLYAMRIAGLQLGSTPYKERAINNALNKVTLYPGRSVLFDRNGRILVRNTPSYDLKVFPKKMGKADSVLICQILGLDSADYAERTLMAWINSKKRQRNNSYNRSAVFYSNLSPEQYAIIRENLYRLKAYYVEPKTDRLYNFNGSAHAFGYLGEVSEELLNEDPYYQPGDLVGITGVEKYYETQIRGIKGVKTVWQDRTYVEQGTVKNESFNKPAIAGPDVTLSLDMALQLLADSLMAGKRGSIVAIEPKTGEVLAFYNSPNYNPNLLVGQQRTDEFRKLLIDPKKPLYNRAVKGVYPYSKTCIGPDWIAGRHMQP